MCVWQNGDLPRQPLVINRNQQPPGCTTGSCTSLTFARLGQTDAATANHSNKLQSWTKRPRKGRSSRMNMNIAKCIADCQLMPRLGMKPKVLQGRD